MIDIPGCSERTNFNLLLLQSSTLFVENRARSHEYYFLDINECSNLAVCPERSQCVNISGSYRCTCDVGYSGSSQCSSKYIFVR